MSHLIPEKLHARYIKGYAQSGLLHPRVYTLTHSDRTGELFLTIGPEPDQDQISGWYTRLMRDEVLANWQDHAGQPELHVHCPVSGGIVLGGASWRYQIFQHQLRQVLEVFRYGDRTRYQQNPSWEQAPVIVHFNARQARYRKKENWGVCGNYRIDKT